MEMDQNLWWKKLKGKDVGKFRFRWWEGGNLKMNIKENGFKGAEWIYLGHDSD
jgi:hypothetical protein